MVVVFSTSFMSTAFTMIRFIPAVHLDKGFFVVYLKFLSSVCAAGGQITVQREGKTSHQTAPTHFLNVFFLRKRKVFPQDAFKNLLGA